MTAYTARALSTALLQEPVVQTAHGFIAGDVITFNSVTSNSWKLAQADSLVDCQGACMVSLVLDVNTFIATQDGHVTNITDPSISPFTVGRQYYLSPTTPGHLTLTQPSSAGQIILPCFVSDTTTSGYFFGGSGFPVSSGGSSFSWTIESSGPVNMVSNNGYMTSSGGSIVLNLPAAAVLGDMLRITNLSGGFSVHCAGGQSIQFGDDLASTSITATAVGDSLEIVCTNPNVGFQVLSSMGNLTFV